MCVCACVPECVPALARVRAACSAYDEYYEITMRTIPNAQARNVVTHLPLTLADRQAKQPTSQPDNENREGSLGKMKGRPLFAEEGSQY